MLFFRRISLKVSAIVTVANFIATPMAFGGTIDSAEDNLRSKRAQMDAYLEQRFSLETNAENYEFISEKLLSGVVLGTLSAYIFKTYTASINQHAAAKTQSIQSAAKYGVDSVHTSYEKSIQAAKAEIAKDELRKIELGKQVLIAESEFAILQREVDIYNNLSSRDLSVARQALRDTLATKYTEDRRRLAQLSAAYENVDHFTKGNYIASNSVAGVEASLDSFVKSEVQEIQESLAKTASKLNSFNQSNRHSGLPHYIFESGQRNKTFAEYMQARVRLNRLKMQYSEAGIRLTQSDNNLRRTIRSRDQNVADIRKTEAEKISRLRKSGAKLGRQSLQLVGIIGGLYILADAATGIYIINTLDRNPTSSPIWTLSKDNNTHFVRVGLDELITSANAAAKGY